jgi:hypothetical protein
MLSYERTPFFRKAITAQLSRWKFGVVVKPWKVMVDAPLSFIWSQQFVPLRVGLLLMNS